jgi:Rrf2 family protein
MLSNTCKYALRGVIYIAVNGSKNKRIGIKQISSDLGIPTPFLGKILQTLAKHKLLTSTKGPNGGFGLAKEPSKIRLLDIIEIIEGKDIFTSCLLSHRECDHDKNVCPVHERYAEIRMQFHEFFKKNTLTTIMRDLKSNNADNIIL